MAPTPEEEEFARLADNPENLSPEVAKVIFASEWDDAINFYRMVATAAGLSHDQFMEMLDADKAMLTRMVRLPRPMTVEKSKPFVEMSDMLTLARLARYCFEHVDEIGIALP